MVGPAVGTRVTRASSDHQQNTIGASAYSRKWRHGRFRIANVPRTLSAVLTLAEEMATQGAASSAISGTADAGSTPASDGARTGRQRDGHAAARMTTPQRQASGRCSGVPTSMTALQMLSQRCCTGMLSLGCPVLDQCVGGGLPVRGITEVSMPPPLQRSCFSSNLGGSVDRLRGIRELGRPSYACSCCLQYVLPGTRLRNCAMHTVICCWPAMSLTRLVSRHSAQLRTVDWDARHLLFTRKGCLLSPG